MDQYKKRQQLRLEKSLLKSYQTDFEFDVWQDWSEDKDWKRQVNNGKSLLSSYCVPHHRTYEGSALLVNSDLTWNKPWLHLLLTL